MRWLLGFLAGCLLVVAACGADDDDAATAPTTEAGDADAPAAEYVEALGVVFRSGEAGPSMDDELADCVATALVERVGADRLIEAGISPDEFAEAGDMSSLDVELPAGLAESLEGDLGGCGMDDYFIDALGTMGLGEFGFDLSETATTCVIGHLDSDGLLTASASSLVGGSDDMFGPLMLDALAACPDALAETLISGMSEGLGTELSPAAEACVTAYAAANAPAVVDAIANGEASVADQLGDAIAATCPEAFAG